MPMSVPNALEECTAAQLMRRNFISLAAGTPIVEALAIMRLARLRSLPVVRDGVLLGMLSYTSLARVLLERLGAQPTQAAVEAELASLGKAAVEGLAGELEAIEGHATLRSAVHRLCALHSGFLPVVEPGPGGRRLVGLLTEDDLLRAGCGAGRRVGTSGLRSAEA